MLSRDPGSRGQAAGGGRGACNIFAAIAALHGAGQEFPMRIALALAAALLAAPALAADEPVATAPATSVPAPSVAEQIDAYLKSSPAVLDAKGGDDAVEGVTPRDDRKIHGEVSVGVGTGGYRSVYMRSDIPVGENGRVSLAFEDTRNARGYGYYPYGSYGFRGGGPGSLGVVDRQRCDLEGMSATRPLDVAGGPHGRCVGRIPSW
jgi:hypothetical protein